MPWPEGLHLRQAVRLVRATRQFRAEIRLRSAERIADVRSLLGVLALCAAMGATLDLEASGEDEQEAIRAVQELFSR